MEHSEDDLDNIVRAVIRELHINELREGRIDIIPHIRDAILLRLANRLPKINLEKHVFENDGSIYSYIVNSRHPPKSWIPTEPEEVTPIIDNVVNAYMESKAYFVNIVSEQTTKDRSV